ncbi:MAG: hypothetical protein AAGA96_15810 [Verrucomicrobiota bacterium]
MEFCYPRKLVCCFYLKQLCEEFLATTFSLGELAARDAGPDQLSIESFRELLNEAAENARERVGFKIEHASPVHPESEDERVTDQLKSIEGTLVDFLAELSEIQKSDSAVAEFRTSVENHRKPLRRALEKVNKILDEHVQTFSMSKLCEPAEDEWAILSIDLMRYGAISATQTLDELFAFNCVILDSIEEAFDAVSHPAEEARLIDLGDGAIVFLNDLDSAVELAIELQKRWKVISEPILDQKYARQFRMGLTSGRLKMRTVPPWLSKIPRAQAAGPGIALATRLQSHDFESPGSILVDEYAYKHLDPANRARFSEIVEIEYKKHEAHIASLPSFGHLLRGDEVIN